MRLMLSRPGVGWEELSRSRWAQRAEECGKVGAVVTAGWLQEPDCVWAGAGQADSTSAEFVRGADGGGGAGDGDAAAERAQQAMVLGSCVFY